MKRLLIFLILAGALLAILKLSDKGAVNPPVPNESESQETTENQPAIEVVAENLEIPWDLEYIFRDHQIILTERPGRLLIIGEDRQVIQVSGVKHIGEGGLLGVALHPGYEMNQLVYLYLTSTEGEAITNRVEQYKLFEGRLFDRKVIIEGIRGSSVHDGGQIAFGPDDKLYIATGDSGNGPLAQDKNSLNGKILRVNEDGSIPADNPFGNAVYSYGHRNPQGLAWDSRGRLWAAEHGPSGIDGGSGMDELNLIEKGANYGWPTIKGDQTRGGMKTPVIHSGTTETWAPSGLAFWNGRLYFAGLRGETLYSYDPESNDLKKLFTGQYGRLRAVVVGPEGLYITTSNRDGRGTVRSGDDRLILIRKIEE